MSDTTFPVSPELADKRDIETVDYVGELRTALRRPIEQHWLPRNPVVVCDNQHALLSALQHAFYDHLPLRLTPDAIWITLARGFSLHVNKNAEALRHRFVSHEGQKKLIVSRPDFLPGQDNPWPEVFEAFSDQIDQNTGGLGKLVRAEFSTTGPVELGAQMDYAEHDKTYSRFLALTKFGSLHCISLLIAMAFGFFTSAGFFSALVLFIIISAVGTYLLRDVPTHIK